MGQVWVVSWVLVLLIAKYRPLTGCRAGISFCCGHSSWSFTSRNSANQQSHTLATRRHEHYRAYGTATAIPTPIPQPTLVQLLLEHCPRCVVDRTNSQVHAAAQEAKQVGETPHGNRCDTHVTYLVIRRLCAVSRCSRVSTGWAHCTDREARSSEVSSCIGNNQQVPGGHATLSTGTC